MFVVSSPVSVGNDANSICCHALTGHAFVSRWLACLRLLGVVLISPKSRLTGIGVLQQQKDGLLLHVTGAVLGHGGVRIPQVMCVSVQVNGRVIRVRVPGGAAVQHMIGLPRRLWMQINE